MGYQVDLTEDETEILNGIELDQTALDHEQYKRQAPLILELLRSLAERNAIPEIRLKYWLDPEHQIGRLKASHKGLFERNGRQGDERAIVRKYGLQDEDEEFYWLALDVGLSQWFAKSVRDAVKQVR